jgi:hypothetical protein
MGIVSVAAGGLLLLLLVYDVFVTVFVPRGGAGPVTRRVYAGFWWMWRSLGDRLRGDRRRRVLAAGGPLLLPLTVLLWALELVVGFALVLLPFADSFHVDGDRALHPVVTALYVSGFSATTLGVGDVFPQLPALRLLTVAEAALGFALFSASIAYVLSVYGALLTSTSTALTISRYVGTDDQPDVTEVLIDAVRHGNATQLVSWLSSTATRLAEARQAEAQYPLTAYFHVPDDDRGLPQALGLLLELLTVARSLLDGERCPELTRGRAVAFAWRMASSHVSEGAQGLPATAPEPTDEERLAQHDRARASLERHGVALRPVEQSRRNYLALRSTWDVDQHRLRRHYGYPPRA